MKYFSLALAVMWVGFDAMGGTFNIPHFIPAGEYAIGLEPGVILTSGGGVEANIRFNYGVSDLSNAALLMGVGSGYQGFRFGGAYTFDFFPDTEGQPGIGLAAQGIYYNISGSGQLNVQGVPYIHKTFYTQSKDEIEPFLSIPIGVYFNSGLYGAVSNFALGAMFKNTEHLRYIIEFGMGITNSASYISGGLAYYH